MEGSLLNSMQQEKEPSTMQDHNDTNEEDFLPTMEEVEIAFQKLERHKAP
jgi:hypothetical protein